MHNIFKLPMILLLACGLTALAGMSGAYAQTGGMGSMHMGSMHSGRESHPACNGRGKVMAMDTKSMHITLAHGNIPGMMSAMTMAYPVSTARILNGIHVGDSVTFTMSSKNGNDVISALAVIPKK